MLFSNLKIGARLALAFGILLFITLAVALLGIWRLDTLKNTSEEIATVEMQRALLAQGWSAQTTINWIRASAALKTKDTAYQEQLAKDMAATSKSISEDQKELVTLITDDKGKALMEEVAAKRKVYVEARAALIKRQQAGEDIMSVVDKDLLPLATAYLKSLDDVADHARGLLLKTQGEAQVMAQRSQIGQSVGVALAVLLGVVLAIVVTRSIVRPVQDAVTLTQHIAEGNLTARLESNAKDEIGQLLRALDTMSDHLRRVVTEVRIGVESVTAAAGEIAKGSADLSARTEQTAANLEQTAASMEELTSTITQSADTAVQANQLAGSAAGAAQNGGVIVEQAIVSMGQITESSKKISDIIGVIDGIAFQTNILALNAAVEAARAGEQGRGFAVVAGEVRALAGRSAEAAKEIKTLISNSVQAVDEGSRQVSQAGQSMGDIVNSVKRVSDLIGEISTAAAEQRDGINQVNQAVGNLDQMTQQNAALVEESSAAAATMRDQAQRLASAVAVFNVGDAVTLPAQMPPPHVPRVSPTQRVTANATPAPKPRPAATPSAPSETATPKVEPPPKAPSKRLPAAATPKPPADDGDWDEF
ncbi:methyl-accepting chemotaxis protein [Hylemonella sp. W303a]|uniref:methyl-accepting chemotaxis protein n=1 Tax=Hylemonella sp. W303a TaxID=3389873 RepID=UPI00396B469D